MLARWDPWKELLDVEREMRDVSRRVFGPSWFTPVSLTGAAGTWSPAVDVFSRNGDLVVRAELPGIEPDKDVDITVEDGVLTIKGERRHEETTDEESYYRFESSYGSFQRSVPLPQGVNAENIAASYENGILEVVIPQAAELTAAKKIPVTAGGASKRALNDQGQKK